MKTRLFIVRHTETIGNVEKRLTGRKDYEITERGKILIQKLAKELENIKFDKIYSSTSGRAVKTIEPIARKQNINIEESNELCEMYFGIYDGWKWEDVNKAQPEIKQTQNEINEIIEMKNQHNDLSYLNNLDFSKILNKKIFLDIGRIYGNKIHFAFEFKY